LAVVLVEVDRKHFLASIVPVIVNSVLNHHHFIVDIVAFVSKGDFPRSRLGEKQRGKILASWVTRKMRTLAQFAIHDPDAEEDGSQPRRGGSMGLRASTGSATMYSTTGGSMRSKEMQRDSLPTELHSISLNETASGFARGKEMHRDSFPAELHSMSLNETSGPAPLPQNEFHVELPAAYPEQSMIPELPADDQQSTPTASRRTSNHTVGNASGKQRVYELADNTNYSPIDYAGPFGNDEAPPEPHRHYTHQDPALAEAAQNLPGSLLPPAAIAEMRGAPLEYHSSEDEADEHAPPLPSYAQKPYLSMLTEETGRDGWLPSSHTYGGRRSRDNSRPNSRSGDSKGFGAKGGAPALATIPSQREVPSLSSTADQTGFSEEKRIGNRDSTFVGLEDGNWPSEALMHMGIGPPTTTMPKRKDVGKR
jgi:hypothetical protein